jgi:hypothetical protein
MKSKIYQLLLVLCLLACKKKSEDSPAPSPAVVVNATSPFQNVNCFGILTSHKWLKTKVYADKPIEVTQSVFVTDVYAYYPCFSDDYVLFEKDTATAYPGTFFCTQLQRFPQVQTWKLSADNSQLIVSDTTVNYLEELSDTSLQYYRYSKQFADAKLTFRFKGVAKQ